jgi:hypothetical protein
MSLRRRSLRAYLPLRRVSRDLPSKPVIPNLQLNPCKQLSESPRETTLERLSLSPYPPSNRNMRIRLENKSPIAQKADKEKKAGRLLRYTAQESLYEDPQSHKLFAFVTVPSPRKLPNQPIGVSPIRGIFPPKVCAKALILELMSFPCAETPKVPIVLQRVYNRTSLSKERTIISPFTVRGKGIEMPFSRAQTANQGQNTTGRASELGKDEKRYW